MAGNRVDKHLAALEIAVIPHVALHDAEEGGLFHVVEAVILPGHAQDLQRVHVNEPVGPHQGFIGEDQAGAGVHNRLEVIAEQVLFHQEGERVIQDGRVFLLADFLPAAFLQAIQVHFADGQADQVFQGRMFPARGHGGAAAVDFQEIRLGVFRVILFNTAEKIPHMLGDEGGKPVVIFRAVDHDELVLADPGNGQGIGIGGLQGFRRQADDFFHLDHAICFKDIGETGNSID